MKYCLALFTVAGVPGGVVKIIAWARPVLAPAWLGGGYRRGVSFPLRSFVDVAEGY